MGEIEDILNDFDFVGAIENYIDFYTELNTPFVFYRVFRKKGKIKKRHMVRLNYLGDLLLPPSLLLMPFRMLC